MLPIEPYTWQRRHPPRPFGTSTAAHRGLHTYQAGSGAVRRSYTRSTPHRSLGAASRDDVYSCKQETADEDLGEPWCGRGHGRRGTPSLKEALRRRGESLTTAERLHAPSQGRLSVQANYGRMLEDGVMSGFSRQGCFGHKRKGCSLARARPESSSAAARDGQLASAWALALHMVRVALRYNRRRQPREAAKPDGGCLKRKDVLMVLQKTKADGRAL